MTARADTRLVLTTASGLGDVIFPDGRSRGTSLDVQPTLEPLTAAADVTTVDLDAEVGLGTLEVRRAAS